MRHRKPRINRKGKSYDLRDCALFNIQSKKRLSTIIGVPLATLQKLKSDTSYRQFPVSKGAKERHIQAPKYELDIVHSRIASLLLRVKLPDAIHSGIQKRSNITNAECHIGDHPVVTMDIRKFYPSVSKTSIYHFFYSKLQCSSDVSGLLAELCTYSNSLPTGSRLSMPLAYWANYDMYNSLISMCKASNITFTIFVDDLTFSGKNVSRSLIEEVTLIVKNAGLKIHPDKNKFYSADQPKLITGAVVDKTGLKVRNKHHMLIYELFAKMEVCSDDVQLEKYQRELLGRLSAAGQINPKFKQKARVFSQHQAHSENANKVSIPFTNAS